MQEFFIRTIYSLKQNPMLVYLFTILNSFLQIFFPPYPGDTFIALLGYLSSQITKNGALLLIIALSSTIISSIMLYLISFHYSERVLKNKYINNFFQINKIYLFEKWYDKFGAFAIILSKFIPGINSIVLIASGVLKLRKITAILAIILSSIIHNSMLFIVGRVTGNNVAVLNQLIKEYSSIILLFSLLILIIYILILLVKGVRE
ncbi:SNARE associated Golgi protein [Caloramator mitchellensis]|uniref:SNARE associated Golgi protein n=1 Tax=Caloramator mitchellensis TaxID=908809 RepID=A0A0R3JY45_CALMK|nr:VTT domain-containing protein [Caloramator mitchellensis]KRQ87994.1 SNARE associated Golgi protein [Caloramator mitchellensis]